MKTTFHKIAALLMIFVVFFSTTSFAINLHSCGDMLTDASFFGKAENCGMVMDDCSNSSEDSISKENCCLDLCMIMEGQSNLEKPSLNSISIQQQYVVAAFIYTYLNLFEGLEEGIIPFRDYHPPLLTTDIQVLHETFLI